MFPKCLHSVSCQGICACPCWGSAICTPANLWPRSDLAPLQWSSTNSPTFVPKPWTTYRSADLPPQLEQCRRRPYLAGLLPVSSNGSSNRFICQGGVASSAINLVPSRVRDVGLRAANWPSTSVAPGSAGLATANSLDLFGSEQQASITFSGPKQGGLLVPIRHRKADPPQPLMSSFGWQKPA